MPELWIVGRCWTCRRQFVFNARSVLSVLVDPVSNRPPDLGGDPARALWRPVCNPCVDLVNLERLRAGKPPLQTTPPGGWISNA